MEVSRNWTWTIWQTPEGQPDIAVYGPWRVDSGPAWKE